jgi:hypothetical protein
MHAHTMAEAAGCATCEEAAAPAPHEDTHPIFVAKCGCRLCEYPGCGMINPCDKCDPDCEVE